MLADDTRDRDGSVGTFGSAGGPRLILHEFIYAHKIQLWQIRLRTSWTIVELGVIRDKNATNELIISGKCGIKSLFSLRDQETNIARIIYTYVKHVSYPALPWVLLNRVLSFLSPEAIV